MKVQFKHELRGKLGEQQVYLISVSQLLLDPLSPIVWPGFKSVLLQRAKKVVSDSPGLVDFAIELVIFVLNLPDGQVLFFGEIQITEGL